MSEATPVRQQEPPARGEEHERISLSLKDAMGSLREAKARSSVALAALQQSARDLAALQRQSGSTRTRTAQDAESGIRNAGTALGEAAARADQARRTVTSAGEQLDAIANDLDAGQVERLRAAMGDINRLADVFQPAEHRDAMRRAGQDIRPVADLGRPPEEIAGVVQARVPGMLEAVQAADRATLQSMQAFDHNERAVAATVQTAETFRVHNGAPPSAVESGQGTGAATSRRAGARDSSHALG